MIVRHDVFKNRTGAEVNPEVGTPHQIEAELMIRCVEGTVGGFSESARCSCLRCWALACGGLEEWLA